MTKRYLPGKIAVFTSALLLIAILFGCASNDSDPYSHTTADQPASAAPVAGNANSESGVAGVWQGTTLASCAAFAHLPSRCNAEQKVTITLLENGNAKYGGRYTCAYGNMD
ncbi:MAG TPA: hypothetical protein VJ728_16100 [Candidatus Binataceae bacterium]|nr:hypothetical protein [Candidatus Binataceae bacterium]